MSRERLHRLLLALLLTAGVGLRAHNLGMPSFCCDEYFDVFAARSWLAGEGFQVPGREYTRALTMTRLTAASVAVFGESEWSARVPAMVFGVLTLPLIYVAGRTFFGPQAGLIALALYALSPHGIDNSRFARLYSLLTFLLLGAALCGYRALEGRGKAGDERWRVRLMWLGTAAAAGLLATTLHPLAISLAVSVQIYVSILAVTSARAGRRGEAIRYGGIALAILAVELVGAAMAPMHELFTRAVLDPMAWYEPRPGDRWLYHDHLAAQYGVMWYLLVPATAIVLRRFKPGLFVVLAFWLTFISVSMVVATKHPRYIAPMLPFAWLIFGGAAEVVWRELNARGMVGRIGAYASRRPVPAGVAVAAIVLVAAAAVLQGVPSFANALRRPWQQAPVLTTGFFYDWRAMRDSLEAQLTRDAHIVSDMWHASIYYLERPSYQLFAGYRTLGISDWENRTKDDSDKVVDVEQLQPLRARHPTWIIASSGRWRERRFFRQSLVDHVEATCRHVPTSGAAAFAVVFDCGGSAALTDPERHAGGDRLKYPGSATVADFQTSGDGESRSRVRRARE
jgi:4-amino-4-deoxy-L-arabinose transferase-like glycosyltransferase